MSRVVSLMAITAPLQMPACIAVRSWSQREGTQAGEKVCEGAFLSLEGDALNTKQESAR